MYIAYKLRNECDIEDTIGIFGSMDKAVEHITDSNESAAYLGDTDNDSNKTVMIYCHEFYRIDKMDSGETTIYTVR